MWIQIDVEIPFQIVRKSRKLHDFGMPFHEKTHFDTTKTIIFSHPNSLIIHDQQKNCKKISQNIYAELDFYTKFAPQMCGTWTMRLK
jgi:hypothetical protein